jgi:hypothetical protein
MKTIELANFLSGERDPQRQLAMFALLNLGIVESLEGGELSPASALHLFYNADNCLYVRKTLREKTADAIMSHGVQLQDLLDALPGVEAQQEFQRELTSIRSLCLELLHQHQLVA